MSMLKTFLMAALVSSAGYIAHGQTVDEVINNYITAMGGKDKLNSINSVYMEGTSVMQNGNEVNSKLWKVNKKLIRREVNFGMGSFSQVITDKNGWATNIRNGGAWEPLPAEVVKAQQMEMDCAGPLVDYVAKGHKAELAGKETINGKECFNVNLTLNTGRSVHFFIDPSTWYVVRTVSPATPGMFSGGRGGQGQTPTEIKIEFSDYKKTPDGYIFPFAVNTGFGGTLNYEKIEVNKPVDASLYEHK